MESQNHFYGHSACLAGYVGRGRPRHVAGLIQHGWTGVSPVATHFRDFPRVGLAGSGDSRRLLVWSHASRAWDPSLEERRTTPIGAPFAYLVRAAGPTPAPRDERDGVVLMPVHGIETQWVRGDHDGLARHWREQEGPATVCLYAADAGKPEITSAYRKAGHRMVVLGERMDPAFLWRLWTLVGRARRVVSNRLSTPVVYAAHVGADIAVYGDAMSIEGEGIANNNAVRQLWPELHGQQTDPVVATKLSADELGVHHLLGPEELDHALGWDRSTGRVALDYWTISPGRRAIISVRRRRSGPAGTAVDFAPSALGWGAWGRAAMTYLPTRLPASIPALGQVVEPLVVD